MRGTGIIVISYKVSWFVDVDVDALGVRTKVCII